MTQTGNRFLLALGAALRDETVDWQDDISASDWKDLLELAQKHAVLPMIYTAVYACPAFRRADPELAAVVKHKVLQEAAIQTMNTAQFLALYRELDGQGLAPIVVKGLICRNLYPQPDLRRSGDEDLLVPPDDYEATHDLLTAQGFQLADPAQNREKAFEVTYVKPGNRLRLEVHKSLFPPESLAYGDLNRFFETNHADRVTVEVEGVTLWTLHPTDHCFYLICHAFKHFLHSGFGLRQICDLVLFAGAHDKALDWQKIFAQCTEIRAERFAAAMFRIGETWLGFQSDSQEYARGFGALDVDEQPLLEDLLSAGIYGADSLSRKHSSTVTLNAVEAQKTGKKIGLLRTLFPKRSDLTGRYPYLEKNPMLLPVAWGDRMVHYRKELAKGGNNSAKESLRIGEERVKLLQTYGILEGDERS